MGVPSKPLPTLNVVNASEDPKTRDVLQELQSILTANVDRNNLKDGEVTKAKLATDALNAFLKLAVAADIKVDFGRFQFAGTYGLENQAVYDVPHALGKVPAVVVASASPGITTGSGTDPIVVSPTGVKDNDSFQVRVASLSGGTMNFPGIWIDYIAIG